MESLKTSRPETEKPARPLSQPDHVMFEEAATLHQEASARYRAGAGGLGLLAILFVIAGVVTGDGGLALVLLGVFTLLLAAIPLSAVIERNERVQGLSVLRDEWEGIRYRDDNRAEREGFIRLLDMLYAEKTDKTAGRR